jgi:outer membrane protein assembly factor BamB
VSEAGHSVAPRPPIWYFARMTNQVLVVAFFKNVTGLDPATGRVVWTHRFDGMIGATIEMQIVAGRVYASDGYAVHCLEQATGQLIGKVPLSGGIKGRPTMVIQDEHLYVATAGEVTCMTMGGDVLWQQGFERSARPDMALGFEGNVRQADS